MKQYIHLELDKDKKEVSINIENINGEDVIYLLSEFISFISEKEEIPHNVLINLISKAIDKKVNIES
ncbi:hypothetical protein [Brachyspira pilosicoli]|uniref:hypothetical protein n=1 Tax=Brachyspira pilosicoli TaxID=52584 RepID=UPI00266695A0|nr:hypothetical protein [Brachyspira pilosicoli]